MTAVDLVLGLGTEDRHDDAAGLVVARRLDRELGGAVPVRVGVRDLPELVDLLAATPRLLVTDAVRAGGAPGAVVRWSSEDGGRWRAEPVVSTHGLSFTEAYELAGALARRPSRTLLYGVEAQDLSMGSGLSPAVEAGVAEAVRRILAELRPDRRPREDPVRA